MCSSLKRGRAEGGGAARAPHSSLRVTSFVGSLEQSPPSATSRTRISAASVVPTAPAVLALLVRFHGLDRRAHEGPLTSALGVVLLLRGPTPPAADHHRGPGATSAGRGRGGTQGAHLDSAILCLHRPGLRDQCSRRGVRFVACSAGPGPRHRGGLGKQAQALGSGASLRRSSRRLALLVS